VTVIGVAAECSPDAVGVESSGGALVGVLTISAVWASVVSDDGAVFESVELSVVLRVRGVELAEATEEVVTLVSAPPEACTTPLRGSTDDVGWVVELLDESEELDSVVVVVVPVEAEVSGEVDSAAAVVLADAREADGAAVAEAAEPASDEEVSDEGASDDAPESDGSASATPGLANAVPTPRKIASAPTRPMNLA
jgi:hypothetical protein